MAKVAGTSPVEQSVAHLMRLLIEYTQKLGELTTELSAVAQRSKQRHLDSNPQDAAWRRDILVRRFKVLRPAIENLARRCSGFIENTSMDETVRIELTLRLSELESMIEAAQIALDYATVG